MTDRFSRTRLLLGDAQFARLSAARIAVFGLGAVGSYAVEALARAGVGFLRLVDFDTVRETNINRQLLALESTIGRAKVDVARERVAQINPACTVDGRITFVDDRTVARLLADNLDIAIDAIDSLRPKVILIRTAVSAGVPIISSMGAASRQDPFRITVDDIDESNHCPLARRVRKLLHRQGIHTGVRCVYSDEPPNAEAIAPSAEPDTFQRGRLRRPVGSLSYITGMFGLHAAREAVRMVLAKTYLDSIGHPTQEVPHA
jgi:tRNA A37 threonylcarbamoyladenosine dehydratase